MNKITRRTALVGMAMGAPLTVASFHAIAAEDDPLIEMAREYFAVDGETNRVGEGARPLELRRDKAQVAVIEAEVDRLASLAWDIKKRIEGTPARTAEGLRAKVTVLEHAAHGSGEEAAEGLILAGRDALRLGSFS